MNMITTEGNGISLDYNLNKSEFNMNLGLTRK